MDTKRWILVLAILPLALVTVAASHDDDPNCRDISDDPEEPIVICTETNWFHCIDDVKVQNYYALTAGQYASWDTTEPAGSVTDGEGCGYYENLFSADGENPYDVIHKGTYTGLIDSFSVELHNIHVSSFRALGAYWVGLRIVVDGVVIFENETENFVTLFPEPSDTGLSEAMRFTVLGVDLLDPDTDDTEHTVTVQVKSYNDAQAAWVWDTTEVPAHITFNNEFIVGTPIFVG
ncbi:MAG: hypothetical protein KY469_18320 [Actinobacteria bacterium]|nr:hypothetical protein [Actinomycetota bacterium]